MKGMLTFEDDPFALDDLIAWWERRGMLTETPLLSDSAPPPSWSWNILPETATPYVDENILRGLIHVMPSRSEAIMSRRDPWSYMRHGGPKRRRM